MIQAIIFDCFGVLTTDAWLPFKNKYFGHNPAFFEQASEINKLADGGIISSEQFLDRIGQLAAIPTEQVRQVVTNNVANQELLDYAQRLKTDYKIGLLSNASADWLNELFSPQQVALFDVTALSYESGVTKPMPEAYQIVADRLNLTLEECVFIDDQERFVIGAREVGMAAIWYRNNDQLFAELEQLLADSKN